MAKKQFATNFDESILKAMKIKALEENKPLNEILEALMVMYLEGKIQL